MPKLRQQLSRKQYQLLIPRAFRLSLVRIVCALLTKWGLKLESLPGKALSKSLVNRSAVFKPSESHIMMLSIRTLLDPSTLEMLLLQAATLSLQLTKWATSSGLTLGPALP